MCQGDMTIAELGDTSFAKAMATATPGRWVEAVALFGLALGRDRDDQHGLGTQILKGLADQIHGTLAITLDHGTTVTVDFPTVSA